MILSDGSMSIAPAEARHPLESAHIVEGHNDNTDVDLLHLQPHQLQLEAGVDSVGRNGVIGTTVGDVSDHSLMTIVSVIIDVVDCTTVQ